MVDHVERNDIDDFFSTARVAARQQPVELGSLDFRAHLIDLDDPMLTRVRGMDYESFAEDRRRSPFLRQLLDDWYRLYEEQFIGITVDGSRIEDLYDPPPTRTNDLASTEAAANLLEILSDSQRQAIAYGLDAPEWRGWSNPEFVFFRNGLRIEDQSDAVVEAILAVVATSLSPEGFARVREAMELNGYLGELVALPMIMNDRSYWFSIFGEPSVDRPWGWQLYGHHIALNFVTVGGTEVLGPIFLGAEPALSGAERAPLFAARESLALRLAGSLDPAQRDKAVVFDSVLDPAMPVGRVHPADERHVAGAFRDNRIVPYEGISAGALDERQWDMLCALMEDFLLLMREGQRSRVLSEAQRFRADTYFSWYGATDGSQPFYFRIHSPVILAELDHHAGVWLNNRVPARFHVHTTLRFPNGNDYARVYLRNWRSNDGREMS
jgi:hypothetical protein